MAESPSDDELDSIYERYVEEWLDDSDLNPDWVEAIADGSEARDGTSSGTAWNNIVQNKLPKPSSRAREGGKFVKGMIESGTWNAWRRKAADWFGNRARGKAQTIFGSLLKKEQKERAEQVKYEGKLTTSFQKENLRIFSSDSVGEIRRIVADYESRVVASDISKKSAAIRAIQKAADTRIRELA